MSKSLKIVKMGACISNKNIKYYRSYMRITVDIDVNNLRKIQQMTGKKKKSPAISQALSEFIRQQEKRRFVERALSGGTDYALTNNELEGRDVYEAR